MNHENKNAPDHSNPTERQEASSPEDTISKRDALFGIRSYPAEELTRVLVVERSPQTPGGDTWPDSGWMLSGEGIHPKNGERVAKLEKIELTETGQIVYDAQGKPVVHVKYQPLEAAFAYDAAQRGAAAENEGGSTELEATPSVVAPQEAAIEQAKPDISNPVRFGAGDALRIVRYRTPDGEARGVAVGYYYDEHGNMMDLIERIDERGAKQGEVVVYDGDVVVPGQQEAAVDDYDKLFDPNYEPNFTAEDAAVRPAESEGERLTRERRARDAEHAVNQAYLRKKGGSFS